MCSRSSCAPIQRAPSISFWCEVSMRTYSWSSVDSRVTFSFRGMYAVPAMTCWTYAFQASSPALAAMTTPRIVPKKIRSRRMRRRRASESIGIDRLHVRAGGVGDDVQRLLVRVRERRQLRPALEQREQREHDRRDEGDQQSDPYELVAVTHHHRVPA